MRLKLGLFRSSNHESLKVSCTKNSLGVSGKLLKVKCVLVALKISTLRKTRVNTIQYTIYTNLAVDSMTLKN